MIDIKLLRQNPEIIKDALKKRGVELDVEYLLELDKKIRKIKKEVQDLRAQRNEISPLARDNPELLEKGRELKQQIKKLEEQLKGLEVEFNEIFTLIPNIPLEDVPLGKDENDNVVIKEWGRVPKFNFEPKDHLELGKTWDLIDVERAAKVSGTRFGYLKNEAAILELALINFSFDLLVGREKFTPIIPPTLIRPEAMKGMGYIDTEEDLAERYFLEKDNLFLIGTAEQAIGPMHKDEVFKEEELPKRYVAFSSCFREEAGSYGKDTRGIFRVHQFDKIEMFSFTKPENSKEEHLYLLNLAEALMQSLKIPYRVVKICTGDLARPSAATYDIEAWIPSQNKYRETHSISNCTDFQARRLNIRFKSQKSKVKSQKLEFVHTLNGTAIAIGRTIIAILENYQQKDGRILVPKVLRKYLGFKYIPK
jgi:seryl-tRNA synthetase